MNLLQSLNLQQLKELKEFIPADLEWDLAHFDPAFSFVWAERNESEIAGVLWGRWFENTPGVREAWILLLQVAPQHRRRGVATRLFEKAQQYAREQGMENIGIGFSGEHTDAARAFLAKFGFNPAELTGTLFETTVERFFDAVPWVRKGRLPFQTYVFPWIELSEPERQKLKEEQGPDSWRAEGVSPFYFGGTFEARTSVGLRVGGEVAGWLISHQMGPDTILYGSYFVRKPYRGRGLSIALILEATKRQKKAGVPKIQWFSRAEDKAVKRLYEKMLGSCVTRQEESWCSLKDLAGCQRETKF